MIATSPDELQAFHAERRTRMGASDIPIAAGLSPYKTPFELWLEKTGRVEPDGGSLLTEYGNDFEPAILNRAERLYGTLERDVRVWRDDLDFPLAATLDARIIANGEPINAKTSGLGGFLSQEWGEAGSDQVPGYYYAQSIAEQFCSGASTGHLYAMLNGRRGIEFRPYVVPFDEDVAKILIESARRFWIDHVEADVEPSWSEAEPAAMETLSRRRREPNAIRIIEGDDESHADCERLFTEYNEARDQRLAYEKKEDLAKRALLTHFGDAEQLTIADAGVLTYFASVQNRSAQPARTLTVRTLRVKQNLLRGKQ